MYQMDPQSSRWLKLLAPPPVVLKNAVSTNVSDSSNSYSYDGFFAKHFEHTLILSHHKNYHLPLELEQ